MSKRVVLEYSLADDLPAVEGDATQLRQVAMNLITNASEAIGDASGFVAVHTGTVDATRAYLDQALLGEDVPEGRYVFVEVTDSGAGMDAGTIARIFDPFFTTKFTGRGLGLAAVLGIVRGHSGAVRVSSTPGKGTTFRVLLPCSDKLPVHAEDDAPASGGAWKGSGTVLVVDDEEVVRLVTERTLERAGFGVLTAEDGCEGVALFRQHADEIVAILLDLTMPQMGGTEAFAEMQRIRSDVPAILLSGYTEEDAVDQFSADGLAGFVQKPYSPEVLIDTLREVLDGSRLLP
jgi:CheY-like chemotaxis protein